MAIASANGYYGPSNIPAAITAAQQQRATTQPVAQAQAAPAATDAPVADSNPLQPSYIPTPPTGQATTYDPATTGTATYQNTYNPQTATDELTKAAGVQGDAQNKNLLAMLAAQGISPGSSAAQAAEQNLAGAQTAALAPSLVSAQQYGAGLDTQAGQFNAGAKNATGQFNAGAENTAGQFGAGANNTMTLQNLQDLLQSQEFNSSAFNNAGSQAAGYENQDWLAQLQAQLGLQGQGLQTSGNLAGDQAQQQVPLNPSLFSQISTGIGDASKVAAFA